MAYAYLTLAQLQTQLAERLDDPSSNYWVAAELISYLQEAIRTWQSLTGAWRDRFAFNTTAGTSWYDLTAAATSKIPYTLKDKDVIALICYQLIEPQLAAGVWAGTEMFTLDDVVQAIQRRRDQFLLETGMVTARTQFAAPSAPISLVPLADNIIDIRRAAWIDETGAYTTLWKTDEWGARAFSPDWATSPANPPANYSIAAPPPITLQLIPPPLSDGELELIVVEAGAALGSSLSGAGTLLGIPDNFAHVVKWGAMADLLGMEGEAHDAFRSGYCQSRWEEGIAAARMHTSIVAAYLNGKQVFPQAVDSLDKYKPNWQNLTPGLPKGLALMSWNLVSLSPQPDAGPYSILLDVVCNAPVPSAPGDNVQIGREELDAILDYAQHIASFKQGGQEFSESTPLYQRMVKLAQLKNARLKAAIPFYEPMSDRARRQEILSPRREPVEQEV